MMPVNSSEDLTQREERGSKSDDLGFSQGRGTLPLYQRESLDKSNFKKTMKDNFSEISREQIKKLTKSYENIADVGKLKDTNVNSLLGAQAYNAAKRDSDKLFDTSDEQRVTIVSQLKYRDTKMLFMDSKNGGEVF